MDKTLVERLQGLVLQWRHNAQGCGRKEAQAAGAWRMAAMTLEKVMDAEALAALRATGEGEWVMVPREPTEAMLEAAQRIWDQGGAYQLNRAYKAMLAAAPTPAEPLRDAEAVGDDVAEQCRTHSDAELLECALQVYARACAYDTKAQHDAAMAYKAELLRRLAHPAPQQPAITDAMVERAFDAWCDVADVSEWRVTNSREALRAALTAAQEGKS